MAENPNNTGWNSGSTGSTGSTGSMGSTGTTGSTSSGTSFGTGSSGSMGSGSMSGGTETGSSAGGGFGVSSASDTGTCPHCGQSMNRGAGSGLEQFLGRLGITDDMMNNLKGQFQNVDIDEYLNTARDYLKDGSTKATTYAKDNPGKVAAGVAALAVGAGLLYAAVNRDK